MTEVKNLRLVVVNGVGRGGTNVIWNILQSHPSIVAPGGETSFFLYPPWVIRHGIHPLRILLRFLVESGFPPSLEALDRRLYEGRMANLANHTRSLKKPGQVYSEQEVMKAFLVTKSVGKDIRCTPAIHNYFPEVYTVNVVRHGFAVCEGWMRRGFSLKSAASKYNVAMREIARQQESTQNSMTLRFEDVVRSPVANAEALFDFLGVSPPKLDFYRLKAKTLMSNDGSEGVKFGVSGEKRWIEASRLRDFLDSRISERQIQLLNKDDRYLLGRIIGSTLSRFGYSADQPWF